MPALSAHDAAGEGAASAADEEAAISAAASTVVPVAVNAVAAAMEPAAVANPITAAGANANAVEETPKAPSRQQLSRCEGV